MKEYKYFFEEVKRNLRGRIARIIAEFGRRGYRFVEHLDDGGDTIVLIFEGGTFAHLDKDLTVLKTILKRADLFTLESIEEELFGKVDYPLLPDLVKQHINELMSQGLLTEAVDGIYNPVSLYEIEDNV